MELLDMPAVDVPEGEAALKPEDQKVDRIVFELWQRSSLPEIPETQEAELEEVAP